MRPTIISKVFDMTPEEQEKIKNEQQQEAAQRAKLKATKYFRSTIAGLSVRIGDGNGVTPEVVRFVPFYERVNGDDTRVGYLATDDDRAIAACEADYHVTTITKKDYDASTKEEHDEAGNALAARRAPY